MRRFLLAVLCGFALPCWADEKASPNADKKASWHFPNTDVRDMLDLYARLVGKPVFMAPDLQGGVTIEHSGAAKELPEVLRNALRDQCGISIRDTPEGTLLVEWRKDPKQPPLDLPIVGTKPGLLADASDGTAEIKMRKTDLRKALIHYREAVNKPVFMAIDVQANVTIEHFGIREEIPEVIRDTLLEKYGIAMHVTRDGDVLFEWSKDPNYPRRSDPPATAADRKKRSVTSSVGPQPRVNAIPLPNP